jgi:hypothetical protein
MTISPLAQAGRPATKIDIATSRDTTQEVLRIGFEHQRAEVNIEVSHINPI